MVVIHSSEITLTLETFRTSQLTFSPTGAQQIQYDPVSIFSLSYLVDKVTKFSPGLFTFVSKIIEADHVIGSFKIKYS